MKKFCPDRRGEGDRRRSTILSCEKQLKDNTALVLLLLSTRSLKSLGGVPFRIPSSDPSWLTTRACSPPLVFPHHVEGVA